jgi:F-type H+-transporting ATPase subunit c
MDSMTLIAVASITLAGLTISIGSIGPALGEGRAVATALTALAQRQTITGSGSSRMPKRP